MPPPPYEPRGACVDLIYSKHPETLISGPAGTGKSMACLWKVFIVAAALPRVRILICRKTRASMTESILVTFEEDVLGATHPLCSGPTRANRHFYGMPNGSVIVVGGLDNPDRIMSTQFDLIYAAEATELHEQDWEKLASRLRNNVLPYQQIMGDCNPDSPTHWLKRRCDESRCKMIESRHEDNPLLWGGDDWTEFGTVYIDRLASLTGVRRERLRFGRWVSAEGVVYEDWDARAHVVKRFAVPKSWRKIRAVDFGYTNPFVCIWIACDNDGRAYVYRYIYRSGIMVADHAEEILKLTGDEKIEATICDHDAEGNATLRRAGIPTTNAKKPIGTGIAAVQDRLRGAGDGRARLFILADSLVAADEDLARDHRVYKLEQEFDSYSWPRSDSGKAVKEIPIDRDNHALDALRYGVMYLDRAGVQSIVKTVKGKKGSSRRARLRNF